MSDIHEHWRISVEAFGDVIIAIESECLAGRELSEIDCATIRHAISHLTAFLGDADELTSLQAENKRMRGALKECEAEIDQYIRQEYPGDHPVHERRRRRDFSANPARVALHQEKGE